MGRQILILTQAFEVNAPMSEGAQICSLQFFANRGGKKVHRLKKKKKNIQEKNIEE